MRVIFFCMLLLFGSYTKTGMADRPAASGTLLEVVVYPVDYQMLICTILTELGVDKETVKIIIAQAMHESANFTSKIFVENNNCFGMKEAKVRPNLCTGTNRGHATYNTVEDGIIDYYLYMINRRIPMSERNLKRYVTLLYKKRYFFGGFGDPLANYIVCVRKFYKTVNV